MTLPELVPSILMPLPQFVTVLPVIVFVLLLRTQMPARYAPVTVLPLTVLPVPVSRKMPQPQPLTLLLTTVAPLTDTMIALLDEPLFLTVNPSMVAAAFTRNAGPLALASTTGVAPDAALIVTALLTTTFSLYVPV